jgi:hypothetical protein
MVTIIRDRFQDAIKKGQTVEQIKTARMLRDYEGRWGATSGFWTTDAFIDAAYKSLTQPARGSAPAAAPARSSAPPPAARGGKK